MNNLNIIPVHQDVIADQILDVSAAVQQGLQALPLQQFVHPGMRVAVAVGSRGISCLGEVLETLIASLQAAGAQPYLIPAMGSHGASTAEGQKAILEGYGLKEERLGAPILATMDTVEVGRTPEGMPVLCDRFAVEMDGIILVNRIKEHTAFKAPWESGLMKILAVGLGKARGAEIIHGWAADQGMGQVVPAAARVLLAKLPVLAGVGIIENGLHQAAQIAVLPASRIEQEEPALLNIARQMLPKIPFDPLDCLVLEQIGKDISGTGMDLNVVGMWRRTGGLPAPRYDVIGALDLTDSSQGNAIGMGHADLITRRLYNKVDLQATYKNCLTSRNFAGAKVPIIAETDQALFNAALGGRSSQTVRLVIARNTLALEKMWVSEALLPEIAAHPGLHVLGEPIRLRFDAQGTLHLPDI